VDAAIAGLRAERRWLPMKSLELVTGHHRPVHIGLGDTIGKSVNRSSISAVPRSTVAIMRPGQRFPGARPSHHFNPSRRQIVKTLPFVQLPP